MKAKPSSSFISSLMDMRNKPDEAQGPNLTKQFGNLRLDPFLPNRNKTSNMIPSKTSLYKTVQNEKVSHQQISSVKRTKNQDPQHYLNKGFCIIGMAVASLCVISYLLIPSYVNKKLHKKNISLQHKVLNDGLELHFWIKGQAKEQVLLKIKNDKERTLTANEFEHSIKLTLDQKGHAVLRLDHLGLVGGYYTFLGQIGEDKVFRRRFFVGDNQNEFAYKLFEVS